MKKFFAYALLVLSPQVFANIEQAETHLKLCATQTASIAQDLEMGNAKKSDFQVWFIENAQMQLNAAGIVFRVRSYTKKPAELTVKIFPENLNNVDESWFGVEDFKCEKDVFADKARVACSLKAKVHNFSDFRTGRIALMEFLTEEQKTLVTELAPQALATRDLQILGPIQAEKYEDKEEELDLELWYFKDKSFGIELSQKVDIADSDESLNYLRKRAQEARIAVCKIQSPKTKEALLKLLKP
jgi:hypothetical protein